jgi:DNA-binding MarR family transcriptional regulator
MHSTTADECPGPPQPTTPLEGQPSDDEPDAQDLAHLHAIGRFARVTNAAVRRAGLTPDEYLLLLTLKVRAPAGPVHAGELSTRLLCTRRMVSALILRLEHKGLVRRLGAWTTGAGLLDLTNDGEQRLRTLVAQDYQELRRLAHTSRWLL